MKNSNKIFTKYYDTLYADKDYTSEIDQILRVWKLKNKSKPKLILDVGSGTGNHTFQFAERGFTLKGVDIEKDMIQISESKLTAASKKNVSFVLADITKKNFTHKANLAYSFFFVINYITSLDYLVAFLKGIKKNIAPNGIYVFNAWNGNATVSDPPRIKDIKKVTDKVSIIGTLNPRFDNKLNRSHFLYNLSIVDSGKATTINYQIHQVYWTPFVLKEACRMAGFKEVKVFKHLTTDENFSTNDYILDFACFA